jgi:hypothetical protein
MPLEIGAKNHHLSMAFLLAMLVAILMAVNTGFPGGLRRTRRHHPVEFQIDMAVVEYRAWIQACFKSFQNKNIIGSPTCSHDNSLHGREELPSRPPVLIHWN